MSATLDAKSMVEDFFGDVDIANIYIEGRKFPVENFGFCGESEALQIICKNYKEGRNILVFLPGKQEIENFIKDIEDIEPKANVLPLYSELSYDEQGKVFKNYPNGKIVVATNIAQTSITIDDIDDVIDFGTEKILIYKNGIEELVLNDISKDSSRQRAGRVGRTKPGRYYLDKSSVSYNGRSEYTSPEIMRLNLDKVILKLISVGINPFDIQFFHQPELDKINESIKSLKALKAITECIKITDIGKEIIKYPLSTINSALIVHGVKNGIGREMVLISTILEVGKLLKYSKYNIISYRDFNNEDCTVLAEYKMFKDMKSGNIKNELLKNLNKKNYYRINDIVNKIYHLLPEENNNMPEYKIKSLIEKTFLDVKYNNIFDYGYYYKSMGENTAMSYELDTNSPSYRSCIIGDINRISFKSYYGFYDYKDIITNDINIPLESIIKFYIENFPNRINLDECHVYYDESSEKLYGEYRVKVNGKEFSELYLIQITDEERIKKYLKDKEEKENKIMKENEDKIIIINNKVFNIINNYNGDKFIVINQNDLFKITESKIVKYFHRMNGEYTLFVRCEDYYGRDLDNMRNKIMEELREEEIQSQPDVKINSISELPENNDFGVIRKDTGFYVTYKDIDDKETENNIKKFIELEIMNDYKDKFEFKKARVKYTYKTEENSFIATIIELIADINTENAKNEYEEITSMLKEYYSELMLKHGIYV